MTRVETFLKSLEEQNIYVISSEYTSDSFQTTIDLSSLAEMDRQDSHMEKLKRIEKDRVLFDDPQFIIRHPYEKSQKEFFGDTNFLAEARWGLPYVLEDVLEVEILDKKIIKAMKKKYKDFWLPCDGACGDPEHLEFEEQSPVDGWVFNGELLTLTLKKTPLNVVVRRVFEDIPKLEASGGEG